MDPVEIDIRMRQNVEDESKKAKSSVRGLGDAAKKAQQEVQQSIAIQKKVLGELRSELALLEKDFSKVNVSTQDPKVSAQKAKLSQAVRSLRHEIKLEEDALKKLEKQQQSYTSKSKNLETEIRNVRNEMASLKMQGRENTQEYRVLEERLGLLGTAYKELTVTQKALSTGGSQMAGILSGLNAVSGAFTATAGAMGMVNNNSEAMEKVQTRLQSMMAITIGLQQVSNTLHETSAFRITTVRKAKELWAATNLKVATSLGITNVQAQILMGTLTLGLSVAITAAVAALDRFITLKQEAAEAEAAFGKAVADNAADVLSQYERMRKEWEALGDSLKDKEQYIRDNQDAFDGLGVAVSSVNGADNLFIENTEAFKSAIMQRAKAAAHMDVASENYKKYLGKLSEADEREKNPSLDEEWLTSKKWYDRDGARVLLNKGAVATADKMRAEAEQFKASFEKSVDAYIKSTEEASGLFKTLGFDEIKQNTKAFWEKQKKDAETALSLMKDSEEGTAKWTAELKKLTQAEKVLETWNFKGKTSGSGGSADKKIKAAKDFKNLQLQIEKETNAAVMTAMEKGLQKKLKQIDQEYELKKQRIEARRKELEEKEKFLEQKAPASHKQLDTQLKTAKKKRDDDKSAVRTAYNQEATKEWNDLLKKYQTYEDKKTEILKRYKTERLKIEKKNIDGQYDANLSELEKAKGKELFTLEKEAGGVKSAIAAIFSNLSGKSNEELEKILQKVRKIQKLLNSGEYDVKLGVELNIDKEMWESLRNDAAALSAINEKGEQLERNTKTLGEHLQNLFKKDVGKEEFEASFAAVNSKIQSAIALTRIFSQTLADLSDLTGDDALGDVADSFSAISDVAGSAMQGAQAGMAFGPTGAAIGAGLGLVGGVIGKISKAQKEHAAAMLRIEKARYAQQVRYNQLFFETRMAMKDRESIFGVDAIYKAVGYLALYNERLEQLQDKIKNKKWFPAKLFGIELKTVGKFATELDKIQIKTGHRKGNLFRRGKDYFSSITSIDKYKDILNEKGELNINRAKALAEKEQFKDGHREKLEEIISLYEQAQKAEEAFLEYTRQTFGSLGDGIVDSVVNALQSGEDAFESFAKSVGGVMGKLGKQIMYELFVSSRFKEFQQQLRDIYQNGTVYKKGKVKILGRSFGTVTKDVDATTKNVGKKVHEAIGDFANSMKGEISVMKEFAKEWQKQTRDMGLDVWTNESNNRSVASKGIAQASQDSIDDVLGRLYALVRFVNEIKEFESLGVNLEQEGINLQTAMLAHLDTIAQNTEWNKKLGDIMTDIREMKEHGIKVKV